MPEIKIPDDIRAMPFEAALAELEALVAKMENGGLALEELMAGFERGRLLTEYCRGKLAGLERRIVLLTKDDGGEGQWTDFAPNTDRNRPEKDESGDLPF